MLRAAHYIYGVPLRTIIRDEGAKRAVLAGEAIDARPAVDNLWSSVRCGRRVLGVVERRHRKLLAGRSWRTLCPNRAAEEITEDEADVALCESLAEQHVFVNLAHQRAFVSLAARR